MADAAQMTEAVLEQTPTTEAITETTAETTPETTDAAQEERMVFRGVAGNMSVGFAMIVAGGLAFTMGLTEVFFATATAWTFVIWGALLIYVNLLDYYQTYTVTEEALIIRNPLRPWDATKVWNWGNVIRMDVMVKRRDARLEDGELRVYFQPTGDTVIEREDRVYDPELARLIVEYAVFSPEESNPMRDFEHFPPEVATTYTWR